MKSTVPDGASPVGLLPVGAMTVRLPWRDGSLFVVHTPRIPSLDSHTSNPIHVLPAGKEIT